ncbi:MAG TPA: hypothetical protein VLS49_17695, partial [Usitatibacter sp.]|nr:hypothetical protein [Usitatibacter sp.]
AHTVETQNMNNVRIERMLRELHAGPPLRFFEDLFALREIVARLVAGIQPAVEARKGQKLATPTLAGRAAS